MAYKLESHEVMSILAHEIITVSRIIEATNVEKQISADAILSAVHQEIRISYLNGKRDPDNPYVVMATKLLKMIEAMGDVARAEQL